MTQSGHDRLGHDRSRLVEVTDPNVFLSHDPNRS
jgi:hypothetical protein